MIRGFFILLLFQLVGEVLPRGLSLPAPGPVIGLALLVAGLAVNRAWRPFDDEALGEERTRPGGRRTARQSLAVLRPRRRRRRSNIWGFSRRRALALAASLVVSTLLTLVVTVGVFVAVKRLIGRRAKHDAVPPLGLSADDAALLADDDTRRLHDRRDRRLRCASASVGQSCCDRHRPPRDALEADRDGLPDLFQRRAVRPLPARPGDGRARGAALSQSRGGQAQPPADGGGAVRRRGRRHCLGAACRAGARRAADRCSCRSRRSR